MPKDRRYNIKQKKELVKILYRCHAVICKAEGKVDEALAKWLYFDDVADYKNVFRAHEPFLERNFQTQG